jgi:membrane protein DedA with SNARE-associated domain
MSSFDELHRTVLALLERHGLWAAALLLLIEEGGVPIPIPGDFGMVLLGAQARQGRFPLWQPVLVLEAATVAGGLFLYGASRWAGRPLVERFGRRLRLTPERLDRAERRLERHGAPAVAAARLVPGLRIVTAVACGVLGVPLRVFLPGLVSGSLLYVVAYVLLGYFAGPAVTQVLTTLEHVQGPLVAAGVALGLLLVAALLARARRRRRRGGRRRRPLARSGPA